MSNNSIQGYANMFMFIATQIKLTLMFIIIMLIIPTKALSVWPLLYISPIFTALILKSSVTISKERKLRYKPAASKKLIKSFNILLLSLAFVELTTPTRCKYIPP